MSPADVMRWAIAVLSLVAVSGALFAFVVYERRRARREVEEGWDAMTELYESLMDKRLVLRDGRLQYVSEEKGRENAAD